jgi:hypothetical protein
MIESHVKEGLSRAYAIAVAHNAGMNFSRPDFDYGFDGTFREVQNRNGRYCDSGFSIDIQLKSTVNIINDGEYIRYNLKVKNYNDLIITELGTPRILVLFVLPPNKTDWLNISETGTSLRNCAWWCSLRGMPPSSNVDTVPIRIPKNQILTSECLKELMNKVKMGEEL